VQLVHRASRTKPSSVDSVRNNLLDQRNCVGAQVLCPNAQDHLFLELRAGERSFQYVQQLLDTKVQKMETESAQVHSGLYIYLELFHQ
jgi:hypothetical protein